jgi:single-stranded-DNA-specific exonuclease
MPAAKPHATPDTALALRARDVPPRACFALEQGGVHPLLARLFAARGVRGVDELDDGLARLLPPEGLHGARAAAQLLADALDGGQRIVIVADYDCDGATACAVALRGLVMLGAAPGRVGYLVPDRRIHGYGLTPTIVDLAMAQQPDVLVTVDNGIASLDGVAHARARGLRVLVTDHHLPAVVDGAVVLPQADVIVNPNQPGCAFESKALAGVGVMFYVLLALRAELRGRGRFGPAAADRPGAPTAGASPGDAEQARTQPRLDALLDLVALGTVADVVKLDANNRRLVAQGLRRIRAGRMQAGVAALFAAARRDPLRASAFDFGFALGPRINAAGRLEQMNLGIECLTTDDPERAARLAQQLDEINRQRRDLEAGMREQAEALLAARIAATTADASAAVVVFDPAFHEGVVGIIAGRLKDRLHRPTFVFAVGMDGLLKGSGRSIAGFHLRDALDLVSKRHAGVLKRFGGHAMAAGCTIAQADLPAFEQALRQVAAEWLDAAALARVVTTDGPLSPEWFNTATVSALDAQVWGQGFEAPLFCDEFEVVHQRLVGDKHLKLRLRPAGLHSPKGPQGAKGSALAAPRDAIWFGHAEPVAGTVRLAYRLNLDEFQGQQRVQMVVEAAG